MTATTIPRDRTILRTLAREMPDRSLIEATVGLHMLAGNREAYWTATVSVWEARGSWSGAARKRNKRDSDGGGADHGAILRAFPKLAPIVALHLAGPDGVPMYALENPRYHLEQGNTDAAASILRCAVDDLPALEDLEAYIAAQTDRWAREAREAYALLLSLPTERP